MIIFHTTRMILCCLLRFRPQTSSSGGSDVQGYHSASTMDNGASPLHPPDLLMNNKAKTSTPSAAYPFAGLHQRSSAAPSPVPSTISSVLTNQSFHRMVPYQVKKGVVLPSNLSPN